MMHAGWRIGLVLGATIAAVGCGGDESKSDTGDGSAGSGGASVILDGGGVIPPPPSGEDFCAPGVCNYQKQDCASGQSCVPSASPPAVGDWPPECMTAGAKTGGQACSQWNDCIVGYFCAGIGATTAGTCRKLCCGGDWSACPAGESCYQQLYLVPAGGGDPVYANADLCAKVNDCDVFTASSCPSGKSCQIVDPTGNVACVTSGSASAGEACSGAEPCVAGFACVGGACRRLCRAVEGGGEPACQPGEGVCVHFVGDPPGVGECTPTVGD